MKCMRNPAAAFIQSFLPALLLVAGGFSLAAQTSNRVWFVTYNGFPTPSSDVSVQSLATSGGTNTLVTGAAANFACQTNFPAFNSPFDVAVDPAMGKIYVLDNNISGVTPEYIYAFSLTDPPAQAATNAQIIYSLLVPAADSNATVYPLISGLALDASNHFLYFNQIDVTTATNSFIGRLDLATSAKSDIFATGATNPAFHAYYTGQVPGQGPIALDATNIYLGAISRLGNAGIFVAPRSGAGAFSEIVTNSAGDLTFSNGLAGGVASDPQDHLIYYLTANAGVLNGKYDLSQNALWAYDTIARTTKKISSGYPGCPDNLALDSANSRYYFTLGRDGTGNPTPTNYQAIYTGTLGSTNAPTLLYRPALSGQDAAGQINAGEMVLQGIFVADIPPVWPPANKVAITTATNGWTLLFTGVPTRNYVVQSAPAVGGPWSDLSPVLMADANGLVKYTDPLPLPQTRFYRVTQR